MRMMPFGIVLSAFVLSDSMTGLCWGFSGGNGTAQDPYWIADANDLAEVGYTFLGIAPYEYSHFVLVNDVDLSGTTWSTSLIPEFSGEFDGNGHVIRRLTIADSTEGLVGLFGELKEGASVKNLGVVDINMTGVGTALDAVTIGGLVGQNLGVIANCYTRGTVAGDGSVGGLVGANCCTIRNSFSTATVTGAYVGGLVGSAGGGDILNCYSIGTVTCHKHVGAWGETWGDAGGLVGGGYVSGNVINSLWDKQTSHCATGVAGKGLNTQEMKNIQTYLAAGWDLVGEAKNGTSEIWQMPPDGGYPILSMFNGYHPPQLKGKGTARDPFLISSPADLGAVVWYKPCAYYRLVEDVNLGGIKWSTAVIPEFSGTFEGNGLCIRNLRVAGGDHIGLFGWLTGDAQVWELALVDVNVAGLGDCVGGLVGESNGDVCNCNCTGTVVGHQYVGGLAGYNIHRGISNCSSDVTVTGDEYVGGLIGENEWGTVTNCYSVGPVTGSWAVGGLAGDNGGSVSDCYSARMVTVTESICAGGLVGYGFSEVEDSFWDIQTSGQSKSDGGEGKTTAQMQDINTYLAAGWDFVGETRNGSSDVWQMPVGGGYPVLSAPPQLRGQGTVSDPYQVSNVAELLAVRHHPGAFCRLTADLDLSGKAWSTAVIPAFSGEFDGNGHIIRNLTIAGEGGSCLGLFGTLTSGASVKNLGVADVNIDGSLYNAGALVGKNEGNVLCCYSTGTIRGEEFIGGLVGYNDHPNSITDCCYSIASVTGSSYVGGLMGGNDGQVTDCYSAGMVKGDFWTGGLISLNWGSVTGSFWDTQASGCADSAAGKGLTTVQIKAKQTYMDAGWDFIGEAKNGTKDIWCIPTGDYPHLSWERICQ
jgi:hypothetical protein